MSGRHLNQKSKWWRNTIVECLKAVPRLSYGLVVCYRRPFSKITSSVLEIARIAFKTEKTTQSEKNTNDSNYHRKPWIKVKRKHNRREAETFTIFMLHCIYIIMYCMQAKWNASFSSWLSVLQWNRIFGVQFKSDSFHRVSVWLADFLVTEKCPLVAWLPFHWKALQVTLYNNHYSL